MAPLSEETVKEIHRKAREDVEKKFKQRRKKSAEVFVPGRAVPRNEELEAEERAQDVVGYLKSFARAQNAIKQGRPESVCDAAKALYGEESRITKGIAEVNSKAVNTTVGSQGAFAIPDYVLTGFIELLREGSVFYKLNPNFLPISEGKIKAVKLVGGAQAHHYGEMENLQISQPEWGTVEQASRKVGTLSVVTKEWTRQADADADRLVMQDLRDACNEAMDAALIRGDGTANTVLGLEAWGSQATSFISSQLDVSLGTALEAFRKDLEMQRLLMRRKHVKNRRMAYIMSPGFMSWARNVQDGDRATPYRKELDSGRFEGKPFVETTHMPDDLGIGGDRTNLIHFDAAEYMVGRPTGMELEMSTEAAYFDGEKMRSAFTEDSLAIKVTLHYASLSRHPESISVNNNRYTMGNA